MTRLVTERDLRKKLGAASHEASGNYAIERTTRIMLRYYETLVHEAEPRHRGLRFRFQELMEQFKR